MSLASNQITNTAAEILVETNNFHQVLQHFTDSGELINKKTTRITIECQICMCKNLALTNPEFDEPTDESHESYIVLPRCGHAFGSRCLLHWAKIQRNNKKCPSCRLPVDCENKHARQLVTLGSTSSNATKQGKDIATIRRFLKESCTGCFIERQRQRRENAQRLEAETALDNDQISERIMVRQAALQPVIREGERMGRRNYTNWLDIGSSISNLRTAIENRNNREDPNFDDQHIAAVHGRAQESITRERNQTERHNEDSWERIETHFDRVERHAEQRINREKRNEEIARQIEAHMSAVQALIRDSMED